MSDGVARIKLPTAAVKEKARAAIEEVNRKQARRNEKRIKARMKKKVGWPWSRRHPTREEAITYLENFDYTYPDMSGGHWRDEAEKILQLCQLAEENGVAYVWLSDEAVEVFSNCGV